MKRLFLWLWFVTGACFLVSVFFLNHILDGIYTPVQDRVFVEQVRGQVYALRRDLAGLDAGQQRERLQQLQPHYGITLTLLDNPPALTPQEQAAVQADGFIVRDQYQQVLLPIEGIGGRWLHLRLPGAVQMTMYMTIAAYLSILLLVGASLYAWVRLLWRDLEALRRHADRIGAGDLQARAQVSPRSQIRVIVDHSNRMAARVAELVQRQRDLTHAISHELRTPIARVAFGLDLLQDSDDRERRARLAQGLHGDLAEPTGWSANCWPTNGWSIPVRASLCNASRPMTGCRTAWPMPAAMPNVPAWCCACSPAPCRAWMPSHACCSWR